MAVEPKPLFIMMYLMIPKSEGKCLHFKFNIVNSYSGVFLPKVSASLSEGTFSSPGNASTVKSKGAEIHKFNKVGPCSRTEKEFSAGVGRQNEHNMLDMLH